MATRMFLHHPDRMGETLPSNGFSRQAQALQAMGGQRIAGSARRPVGALRSPYGQFGETAPAGGTVAAPSAPAAAPTDWKGIFEGGSKLVETLWGTYDKYQVATKKPAGAAATPVSLPPPPPPAGAGGGGGMMLAAAAAVALAMALR